MVIAALSACPTRGDIIAATLQFTQTQDMVAEADRSVPRGDIDRALLLYKHALNAYTRIIAENPDFQPDMIEFRMAYCDERIAQLMERVQPTALKTAQQGATNAPPSAPSAGNLDAILVQSRRRLAAGEPEAAREHLLQGFKIDPDNVNLRLLAGLAQCQARRFEDAIFLLKTLADDAPSRAPIHVALAAAYFGNGDRDAAVRELETAIDIDPALAEAHYNMAQLMLTGAAPDRNAAQASYRRALELGAPPDPRLANRIAREPHDGVAVSTP